VRKRDTSVVIVSTLIALSLILSSSQVFLTTSMAQSLPSNLPHQYPHSFSTYSNGLGINTATPSTTGPSTSNSLFSFLSTQLHPAIANAGKDRVVYQGATVRLDGSRSFDPNNGGVIVNYKWTQIGGTPIVALLNGNAANPSFVAPSTSPQLAPPPSTAKTMATSATPSNPILTFSLTVTDNRGLTSSNPSVVHIVVVPLTHYSSYPTTGLYQQVPSSLPVPPVYNFHNQPLQQPQSQSLQPQSQSLQPIQKQPTIQANSTKSNNNMASMLGKTTTTLATSLPPPSSSPRNSTSPAKTTTTLATPLNSTSTSKQPQGQLVTVHGAHSLTTVMGLSKPIPSQKGGPVHTIPFLVQDPKAFQLAKQRANENLIKPSVKVVTLPPPKSKKTMNASNATTVPTGGKTSPSSATASSSPAATQFNGFNGLSICQVDGCWNPPDQAIGVGPNYVMQFVNNEGQVYTKTGASIRIFDLYSFFTSTIKTVSPSTDYLTDPEIIFDQGSQRWFATIADQTTDPSTGAVTGEFTDLAISDSSDPTGSWFIYNIPINQNHFGDQPAIGTSDDKFAISTNNYQSPVTPTSPYMETEYFIFTKADLVNHVSSVNFIFFLQTKGSNNEFSIIPVRDDSPGSTSTLYMVSNRPGNAVDLYYVTGTPTPTNTLSVNVIPFSISQVNAPPGAQQPGTSTLLNTDDSRVHYGGQPVFSGGNIWLAFNDLCTPSGDSQSRSCFRLDQLNPNSFTCIFGFCSGSPNQDFDVGAAGEYYFYPAIGVDSSGNIDVVFGYSDATSNFPSLAATGEVASSSGTFDPAINLASGSFSDTSGRYGDYFAAATDPSDPRLVYGGGELPGWSTFVGIIDESPGGVQHSTSLSLNSISSVPWSTTIVATGQLVDSSEGNVGIGGRTITFGGTGGSTLSTVTTNPDGTFTAFGTAPNSVATGWTVQAHFAGDSSFLASDSNIQSYNTLKHTSSLAFVSLAPNVPWSRPTSFPVILRDTTNGGTALGAQTIHFTGTGVISVANKVTDSTGKATGTGVSPNTVATGWSYQAQYAGSGIYNPSSTNVDTYNTLKHTTSLSIAISPTSVPPHGTYSVSGTLLDTTRSIGLISKTITFTATSPITISSKITDTAGHYSATGLTAPTTPGTYHIQSHYAGDSLYNAFNSPAPILTVAATANTPLPAIVSPNPIITAPKVPLFPVIP
jgi:hypothetical protein